MEREEAIQWLKAMKSAYALPIETYEAIDMAIEALSADAVPIEKYHELQHQFVMLGATFADLTEVVRCKDCRHWLQHEQFGFDEDNDEYHDYCALLVPDDDYYAYTRKADDFCSRGERSEPSNG